LAQSGLTPSAGHADFQRTVAPPIAVSRQPENFRKPVGLAASMTVVRRPTVGDGRANVAEAATVTRITAQCGLNELARFSMRCAKMSGQTVCEMPTVKLAPPARACALSQRVAGDPRPVPGGPTDRTPEPL